jgi:hypothetical protein
MGLSVKIKFWHEASCSLVDTRKISVECAVIMFQHLFPEDESSIIFRKVCSYLPNHTVSFPMGLYSSRSPP